MLKLMLVDDQAADREAVERFVQSLSDVEWMGAYAEPQEMLDEAFRRRPDVVIAAVEMTDMNGLAFTSSLKEILPSVHVIVAAYSGNHAIEAFDAGAGGYLIKPFDKESLMKALSHARTKY